MFAELEDVPSEEEVMSDDEDVASDDEDVTSLLEEPPLLEELSLYELELPTTTGFIRVG